MEVSQARSLTVALVVVLLDGLPPLPLEGPALAVVATLALLPAVLLGMLRRHRCDSRQLSVLSVRLGIQAAVAVAGCADTGGPGADALLAHAIALGLGDGDDARAGCRHGVLAVALHGVNGTVGVVGNKDVIGAQGADVDARAGNGTVVGQGGIWPGAYAGQQYIIIVIIAQVNTRRRCNPMLRIARSWMIRSTPEMVQVFMLHVSAGMMAQG